MRLICPNCGAQYAVADDVIPPGGRDVQCSNCAHTWFETPGSSSDDRPPEPRRPSRPKPSVNETAAADTEFTGSIEDAFKETVAADPAEKSAPKRRAVDPEVADILREEAARETEIRRTETPDPIENQTDLGLSDPEPAPKRPPASSDAARDAAKAAAGATGAVASNIGSRRELLPDIEEINSSLRSDAERADNGDLQAEGAAQRERRGFRRAFAFTLLMIAFLAAVYVQADAIVGAVPDLAGVMDSYVSTVDSVRLWLDANVRSLMTGGSTEG